MFKNKNKPNVFTNIKTDVGLKKVALCVGINDYPGTRNDLRGCVNDATDWKNYFIEKAKFDKVVLLLDSNARISAFENEIKSLNELNPDVLVITNSSHGTSLPDDNGDEIDGRDEAICFYDGNMRDDYIRKIINKINPKTRVIFISDSCHSGTVTRNSLNAMNDHSYVSVPRYMPPKEDIDASSMALLPLKNSVMAPETDRNEILLSGCKDAEYSYDASFGGRANGAFTYNFLNILKNNDNLTYEEAYNKIRTQLPSSRYPQTPQLECSNNDIKKTILWS